MSNSQNLLTHIIAITSPAFQSKACNPNCTECGSCQLFEHRAKPGYEAGPQTPQGLQGSFHVT